MIDSCMYLSLFWSVYPSRLVKLSSPNLNYFIIIGAVLMYISIFFYILPIIDTDVVFASCIVSILLLHGIVLTVTIFSI